MATADVSLSARTDWILANPWLWSALGFACCMGAAIANVFLVDAGAGVLAVVAFGLLLAGIGLAMRLQSTRPAAANQLPPGVRDLLFGALGFLFAATALALVGLFLLRFIGLALPWRLVALFSAMAVAGPICGYGALMCWRRLTHPGRPIDDREESALLLLLAALSLFCSCWALYIPDDPQAWDTIRLFLAVFFLVALVASPLMLLPQTARRLTVSGLVLLHFGGICTATLAAQPSPWIVQQVWVRVYRPYLEFMYLNNAYHFYSPEPGPASYLWFRLIYSDEQQKERAIWYKVPEMDDKGRHQYPVALAYQRMLATTENTVPNDIPGPKVVTGPDGKVKPAEWYFRRFKHTPNFLEDQKGQPLNKAPLTKPDLVIPFHPALTDVQQYLPPNQSSRWLLESYARHVARRPHPDHPEWRFKSVKIYRVVHAIPMAPMLSTPPLYRDLNALDPELDRPFYMGEYNKDGIMLDDYGSKNEDPFLFWMLPVLREPPVRENSLIHDYARRHAGDPRWVRRPNGDWVEEHRARPQQ